MTNPFDRNYLIDNLFKTPEWDVIVIGGGASGLGVAVDSVTRGFKTLLLEQVDFAKGTSSRSTKLVHGGVRYLAQGQIDLVKEALYERGLLLKNASHLVDNISFIIPNYKWWDNFFYSFGMKVYDFLSGKLSLGKSEWISRAETKRRLPTIKTKHIRGGIVYHDGQFDDARLAINLAQTAIEQGATLLNHFQVQNLDKNEAGKIIGVTAQDRETDRIYNLKSKTIINATGVFSDEILQMDAPKAKISIRPSQGVHLVLDRSFLQGEDAIMIPKTSDGRVLFLVPWHNRVVVGTTDTLLDSHSLEPKALEEEVDFILANANHYLNKEVNRSHVLSVFAGLRPLAAPDDSSEKTKEISRSHKILVSESELITITGGKWTTYRRMAEDTIDQAIKLKKLPNKYCKTPDLPIHGADGDANRENHLYVYGSQQSDLEKLISENKMLAEKVHPRLEFTMAEVYWAIKYEMARTVEDILARRVRMLFLDAKAAVEAAPKVALMLMEELDETEEWKQREIERFNKVAENYII